MSTVTKDYHAELARLKRVFDRDAFHYGAETVKPMTKKELVDSLIYDRRAPGFQNLLKSERIYTDGRIAFTVPKTKTGDALIEACCETPMSGQNLPIASMLDGLKRIEKSNLKCPEWLSILGVSDAGNYLLDNASGERVQVDGWMFETLRSRFKKAIIRFSQCDQPVVFYDKTDKLIGCLAPQVDEEKLKLIDPVIIEQDRWDFYEFPFFGSVAVDLNSPKTVAGRLTIDGAFIDPIFGWKSKFQIDRRDGDLCLWMQYGSRAIDTILIGKFDSKADAIQAVDDIADHVASVDQEGHLEFAL